MKRFLLTFIFWLNGIAGTLHAQSTSTQPVLPPINVSVEFTVIGWQGKISNLGYGQSGRLEKLDVPAFKRSKTFKYSGPSPMPLYDLTKVRESDANIEPVATVSFEPNQKRYSVLIATDGQRYVANAIADDTNAFPPGQARLLNLAPVPIAIRCNRSKPIILHPMQSVLVVPVSNNVLITETAYETNGKWIKGYDDFIAAPEMTQTSVFFLFSNSDHFKSIDGFHRTLEMFILREKPPTTKPADVN